MTAVLKWCFVKSPLSESQKKEWQTLDAKSTTLSASGTLVFATHAHLFMPESKVFYALGYCDNELITALPLTIKSHEGLSLSYNYLQVATHDHLDYFIASGQSNLYELNLREQDLLTSLLVACKREIQGWDVFFSRRWFFSQTIPKKLNNQSYSRQTAYFDLQRSDKIESLLPKKLLKNINRFERKLLEDNKSLELRADKDASYILDSLSHFYRLESSGWKGKAGSAISKNIHIQEFYDNCWKEFASTNSGIVFLLNRQNETIAAGIAYVHGTTIYLHKITYDEILSKNSPGSVLVKHIVQYALDEPSIKRICFNTNPPWIHRWHPQIDEMAAVHDFNNNFKAVIIGFLVRGYYALRNLKMRFK
ncbi:MAG: GNAT family N-acetyltransferase [Kangiellaceae bacterium]|nr:GNAT family N-acetyltransferase [Kangiellaceae bacterium]